MKNYKFAKQKNSDFFSNSNISPFTLDYTYCFKIDNTFSKQILVIKIKKDILLQDFLKFIDSDLESFRK